MELEDLKRLVALGEGYHIEFKRKVPRPDRIAKEIIAFANSGGGKLLLGVDDDGSILGVRDAEEEEFSLRQALGYHCDPEVHVEVEYVPISRKRDVVIIHVPESPQKPHFLIDEERHKRRIAYVRVRDKSIEASREAVRMMRYEHDPRDVKFEFGAKEQLLLRYLERFERITVAQFARLANISRRRASQTLVLLARANILRLHTHEKADYFTLAMDTENEPLNHRHR